MVLRVKGIFMVLKQIEKSFTESSEIFMDLKQIEKNLRLSKVLFQFVSDP